MIALLCSLVWLVPPSEPKALAETLAPFLDDGTLAVLHVDLENFDPRAVKPRLGKILPNESASFEQMLDRLADLRGPLRAAGVRQVFVVWSLVTLLEPLVVLSGDRSLPENTVEKLRASVPGGLKHLRGCLLGGTSNRLQGPLTAPEENPVPALVSDLTAALRAAGPSPVRLVFLLSPKQRRVLEENLPRLPEPVGGGSIKVVSTGLRWGMVALDGDAVAGYQARARIEASDAESAQRLSQLLDRSLTLLKQGLERPDFHGIQDLVKLVTVQVRGTGLSLTLDDTVLVPRAGRLMRAFLGNAGATRDMEHLKQIGLAMHTYPGNHKGRFPPAASSDQQGRPLLSWRVHLLPYLGPEAKDLHSRFKLDEPWDSDHNKKLLTEMPAVYQTSLAPNLSAEGRTTFVVPAGPETIFPPRKAVGFGEIPDGLSNTILVVEIEAGQAVPWTKPADLQLDVKKPLAHLGFDADGTVKALFADGSVRRLKKTLAPTTMAAFFTRNGGEVPDER